jgi:hypothetical protein
VDDLTVLIAARNEEERIGRTIEALRAELGAVEIIVVDGASTDRTAAAAEAAGAVVMRLGRRGKGEALSAGERTAPPGPLLLCDADLEGSVARLAEPGADLRIATFTRRVGGGLGIAKRVARELIRLRTGFEAAEPLSGQRRVGERARAACFPLAPGFGCEVRMTIDALRAGLEVAEVELDVGHRATGRDVAGFRHRGRQLLDALLATGPLGVNHRGLRLPLAGWIFGLRRDPAVTAIAALGLADDLWSGEERGFRAHLASGRSTGILKLAGIPLVAFWRTRSVSAALLVAGLANLVNQLDTKPGRALKAYLAAAAALDAPAGLAVLLLPYDLRERLMLGDAGSNALGAMVGFKSVERIRGRGRWATVAGVVALNLLGERRSFGELIERTPLLSQLDRAGRF